MSLLDRVKALLKRQPLPEDTQLLIPNVGSIDDIRNMFDKIITENHVELRKVERDIERLSRQEADLKEHIRSANLTKREKDNVLRDVMRLGRTMDSLTRRVKIYQQNMDVHQTALDRVDEMQAMELKAISEAQISEIAVEHGERLEKHRDLVAAAQSMMETGTDYANEAEERALRDLEAQIIAEASGGEKPATEKPAPEPAEKPVAEPVAGTPARPKTRKPSIEDALAEREAPRTEEDKGGERTAVEFE